MVPTNHELNSCLLDSLVEELELLEQRNTQLWQEIDLNLAQAADIVNNKIVGLVRAYHDRCRESWESVAFWKEFFESSAGIQFRRSYSDDASNNRSSLSEGTSLQVTTNDADSKDILGLSSSVSLSGGPSQLPNSMLLGHESPDYTVSLLGRSAISELLNDKKATRISGTHDRFTQHTPIPISRSQLVNRPTTNTFELSSTEDIMPVTMQTAFESLKFSDSDDDLVPPVLSTHGPIVSDITGNNSAQKSAVLDSNCHDRRFAIDSHTHINSFDPAYLPSSRDCTLMKSMDDISDDSEQPQLLRNGT